MVHYPVCAHEAKIEHGRYFQLFTLPFLLGLLCFPLVLSYLKKITRFLYISALSNDVWDIQPGCTLSLYNDLWLQKSNTLTSSCSKCKLCVDLRTCSRPSVGWVVRHISAKNTLHIRRDAKRQQGWRVSLMCTVFIAASCLGLPRLHTTKSQLKLRNV